MLRRFISLAAALVVFTASAAVAVLWSAGPANAADDSCPGNSSGPCVVLNWRGSVSGQKTFSVDDLRELPLQSQADYPTCAVPGCPDGPEAQTFPTGVPIRELLSAAGFTAAAVQTLDIVGGGRPAATLSTEDLGENDPDTGFPFISRTAGFSGLLYPIVYLNGADTIDYIRPQRKNEQDASYVDTRESFSDEALVLDADVVGAHLTPTITANHAKIKKNGQVRFAAALPGDPPGTPSYQWDFGDGRPTETTSSPRTNHVYDHVGRFRATVTVTDTAGSSGVSPRVEIQVGDPLAPSTGKKDQLGGGAGKTDNPLDGPNHGTGLHAGATPSNPSSGPHGGPGSGTTTAKSASSGPTSATRTAGSQAPLAPGFVRVNGILIGPASAAPAAAQAQVRSGQPETAPAARAGTKASWTLGLGAGFGAAVVVLLGLGVLGESRRPARATRGKRR